MDITITRSGDSVGASVAANIPALLASVNFVPVAPGSSPITLSGIAMTPGGQPIALQLVSTNVTVKWGRIGSCGIARAHGRLQLRRR